MPESSFEKESSDCSRPYLAPGDYQPLVPLRVDVSLAGTNKASPSTPGLRIVETILLDPWVWPLKAKKLNNSDDWIEDNARYLAHNLLTDMEVQGMGRTIRHFTNRADLWSVDLQRLVMDQLRPQLKIVAEMRKNQRKRRRQDETTTRIMITSEEPPDAKRPRTNVKEKEEKEEADVKMENEGETKDESSTLATEEAVPASTRSSAEEAVKDEPSSESKDANEKKIDEASLSHLIPIQIRLSVHGIRVHDDCWWDPSMSSKVTPLDYATSLGRDLKLSAEAIQSIAVDITEQLYGSPRSGYLPSDLTIVDEGSVAQPKTRTTAAWSMDQRTHISHVAHLVAQHRQP